MSEFKAGDIVELKSGSIPMTIEYLIPSGNDHTVSCVWYDKDKICVQSIKSKALKLYEAPDFSKLNVQVNA